MPDIGIIRLRNMLFKWCDNHQLPHVIGWEIFETCRGEDCQKCQTGHIDVILTKLFDKVIFRLSCRDCGTQWVPTRATEYNGFGVINPKEVIAKVPVLN